MTMNTTRRDPLPGRLVIAARSAPPAAIPSRIASPPVRLCLRPVCPHHDHDHTWRRPAPNTARYIAGERKTA